MSPSRAKAINIEVPEDYLLARDVCSYGYFLLEPNNWDVARQEYRTTLDVGGKSAVTVRITQPVAVGARTPPRYAKVGMRGVPGLPLRVAADRALAREERGVIAQRLARMLRLDEDAATIRAYHKADPRYKGLGRARLMRCPTFFEDVIKTVTSCNVTWPSTIIMNRRLCEVVGRKSASGFYAFPTAARLARVKASTIRARCSVGYRDARIVELAGMFASEERRDVASGMWQMASGRKKGEEGGQVAMARPGSVAWMEDSSTPDELVHEALLEWPGVGPYAAANIMQLLGRYAHLPLDTESVRHGRSILGYAGTSAQVMKHVHAHYAPFGEHKFRSYWFEMWEDYERKRGASWTWERETTGKTFTASKL